MEMEMELSPPAGAGGASAIAVAGAEAKRARKRSRYLSPPYTADTAVKVDDDGEEPDVCAADVLSALRAAALLSMEPEAAQALRFLTLYRRRRTPLLHAPSAAGVGYKPMLNPAPAVGHKPLLNPAAGVVQKPLLNLPTATGSKNNEKNKQIPQQPAPAIRKENEADHKRASQSSDAAGNANNPKRRRKNKKMMKSTAQQHFVNPVALVLDFAQGTPLPSRDDLLSTFCRFGFVIHPETAIVKDQRSARVVFATRAEAEAAAQTLGTFGPPFVAPRLQDLPPITSPPLPKLPLKDIRNNLEKMILSLTRRSSSFKAGLPEEAAPTMGNLVGEMQGLLAKVDKMLQGSASSTVHQH